MPVPDLLRRLFRRLVILVRIKGHCEGHCRSLDHDCNEDVETIVFGQKSASDKPYLQRNGLEAIRVMVMMVRRWGHCEGHNTSLGHNGEEGVKTFIFAQKSDSDEPYSWRNGPVVMTVILESDSHVIW